MGVPNFPIFYLKHTLWVLVRTASARPVINILANILKIQFFSSEILNIYCQMKKNNNQTVYVLSKNIKKKIIFFPVKFSILPSEKVLYTCIVHG